MKVRELLKPVTGNFQSATTVPAGKAAVADFGLLGLSLSIKQPKGDTSKSSTPMPKYKTIPGNKQGTK